ncbi:hypothetical protein BCV69DRAFT_122731 [Microstroma glucosiphilum]|uniref:Uncharacterized protein n=1 Tax=Pseudomicrostroma glucosiphilum TaxID=1684307 RepID=A0A316TXB3_9BASI|nr:hypothetical protein BCV69DRAFT_122731 [Pseudomicrostroma glucosiphilum]PWN17810.1 hypothetical protein BCV69DRAFT_122731 [Pseudomicrostroma glucosiphilum]
MKEERRDATPITDTVRLQVKRRPLTRLDALCRGDANAVVRANRQVMVSDLVGAYVRLTRLFAFAGPLIVRPSTPWLASISTSSHSLLRLHIAAFALPASSQVHHQHSYLIVVASGIRTESIHARCCLRPSSLHSASPSAPLYTFFDTGL